MKDTDCSAYETADGDCLTNACGGCCIKYRAELDSLRLALAEAQHEAETLKTERNTALTLAEQRGSAYDMTWREVESLREWKDKEQEERGRQYGLRLQIADEFAFLRELLVAVVKTGTKDPLLDARITEELRSHE